MNRSKGLAAVTVLLLGFAVTASSAAELLDENEKKLLPQKLDQLEPLNTATIDPSLLPASIELEEDVIIKLKSPPVAAMASEMSPAELKSYLATIKNEQSAFMQRTGTSSKEITCLQRVLNAVFLSIDASEVAALAEDPDAESIQKVNDYEMLLSETVPYIGATIVQNEGYNGTGITMAILDSGIDYTHAAFGGPGTIEAYNAAIKDPASRDGLFPTERVVEGFDFVGELWPEKPMLEPDDDPIDAQGHGTSVADIAGGNDGVAPNVSLYALKVCSAVSSSCSGVATLRALEYVSDPNEDGDLSDALDVANLSLGAPYGQPSTDSLSQAVNALVELGVVVVGAAGNSGDKPYITDVSAAAQGSLSVANTQVPSASLQNLVVDNESYPAAYFSWSAPLTSVIMGPVQYGDGQGDNLDGCMDYAPGSLDGKVVLVDRGDCNFSLKVSKVTEGGGLACIVGQNTDDPPFAGGDGDDRPVEVPGYMISQADADTIKASLPDGAIATLDPDDIISFAMTMDQSSSRGPQNDHPTLMKPEIGAPGSSTAADVGTGTGTSPFGGTSGATPMVAGSAALLLQKHPFLSPSEVKALLMNNGETNIDTDFNLGLAPITRIGGGEVRVDRAITARAAAWDEETLQGALSFGFVDVHNDVHKLFKRIRIRNYSDDVITYGLKPTFRFEEDEASGAVSVEPIFPGKVRVGAHEDRTVSIVMTIYGDRLSENSMNSGSQGNNGDALTANEFDGYLLLEPDDGEPSIHLAWHVLPRKAANVIAESNQLDFSEGDETTVGMENDGVGVAQVDSYSLLAMSSGGEIGEERSSTMIRAVGVSTSPIGPGICGDKASFIWKFAISLWERAQHLFSVRHLVYLDINQDGESDYTILNSDLSGPTRSITSLDGRQLTFSINFTNSTEDANFFAEHSTNTANTILAVCAEQVGLSVSDLGSTRVDVRVEVLPFYRGPDTSGDEVTGITVTPGAERFSAPSGDLGPGQSGGLTVTDNGSLEGNSEELGLMVITNADRGDGRRGGATQETELILLRA